MKNILKSKTLWFNIITAILYFIDKSGAAEIMTTGEALQWNLVGNSILRLFTHKGLTLGSTDEPDNKYKNDYPAH